MLYLGLKRTNIETMRPDILFAIIDDPGDKSSFP